VSRWSLTEIVREREWRRCKGESMLDVDAFEYFARAYCKIQHPEKGATPFLLRDAQAQIIRVWMVERYSIVLKARQIGWSTLVAIYALWLAMFWSDQVIVMLSRNEREARKLLAKADYAYKRFPQWLKDRGPKRTTANLDDITFDNGSKIESLPSKEDPARGSAVSLVIVDEWAFLDNPENAWASIEPITDIGGRCIGLSTANGWGDFFHQMWVKARAGISEFVPMFFPYDAVPERGDAWYAAKAAGMPEWQLHQEYPSNEEEAFIKSGRPVFDTDKLKHAFVSEPVRGRLVTDLPEQGATPKSPKFVDEKKGALAIWEMPQIGQKYVIGADVAEGLEHGDFSSAHVLNAKTGKLAAVLHLHVDADLFGERLAALGWFYQTALVGIEVNNHGLTTNKAIQRARYPRVYFRRTMNTITKTMQKQLGWRTDVATKPLMIDELVRALREDTLSVEDAHTIAELMQYQRDERGKMGGSPYDDRVMSLAVAVQMLAHVSSPDYTTPEDDYGTFDYFMRKVLTKPEGDYVPIGAHNVRDNEY
jgi:hypothetical protein